MGKNNNKNTVKQQYIDFFLANKSAKPRDANKALGKSTNVYAYYQMARDKISEAASTVRADITKAAADYAASAPRDYSNVVKYFMEHPTASPSIVAKMFAISAQHAFQKANEAQDRLRTLERARKTADDLLGPKIAEAVASVASVAVATADPVMDKQVGGNHYKVLSVEPWDAMQAWLSREEFVGFLKGNVLKYMARANFKNGAEDIKKAAHYQEKLVSVLEAQP